MDQFANLLINLGVGGGALAVLRWFAGRALDLLAERISGQLDRIERKVDDLGPCRLQLYDPDQREDA